ncbi:hypothetical protein ACEK07_46150 [Alcanivoracaceae bacterium MT1]
MSDAPYVRFSAKGTDRGCELTVNGRQLNHCSRLEISQAPNDSTKVCFELDAAPVCVEVKGELICTGLANDESVERAVLAHLQAKYGDIDGIA